MNIIHKICKLTLTYKFFYLFYSLYLYIRDYLYISDTFYSDSFKLVLKQYVNLDISVDWLGRLYGIINPLIDIKGNLNINNMVIVLDEDNTNNNDQVKYFVHKQLSLISELFRIEKLYDYIDLSFEHVGPENGDNYLIIFDIVSRKRFANSFKKFMIQLIIYGLIFLSLIMFVF
jgi:hypothetical protein